MTTTRGLPRRNSARTRRLAVRRATRWAIACGIRSDAPYGTAGGSAATTPGAWSRSCAWSRRMNDSSGRGSSSSARSSGTGGQYGPAVPSALSRLIRGGAAYQSPALVSGLLALVTLPLYTRELTPADLGVAETVLTFIILGSIVLRGGLAEALVRLWFTEDDAEARARMARTALGTVAVVTTLVALARAAVRGAARRRAVQPARRGHRPPRDPRALELHEPRDGVRAPARGGAPARRSSGRRWRTCC